MIGGNINITLAALFLLAGTGCAGYGTSPSDIESSGSLSAASSSSPVAERESVLLSEPSVSSLEPDVMSTAITGNAGLLETPKLYLREVEINTLPSETQDTPALAAVLPKLESSDKGLWNDLRRGFRLTNLEQSPDRVARFEKWYSDHPKFFKRLSERAYWFLPYILAEVEARDIPSEVAILPAVESAFRPDATSRSHAAGIWQFISATGKRFGLRQDGWMDARRDLVQSTRAALDYLEYLSQEFDGDWELALAAYNAGEGTIRKQIRRNKSKGLPTDYANLTLRKETTEYIPRLYAIRNILQDPAKFNIQLAPLENIQRLKQVDLKAQTDLTVIAQMVSLNRKQLHFLNRGYVRGVTPPNGPHTIVVPASEADHVILKLSKMKVEDRMQWALHRVKKGEYLGKIASIHGVNADAIRAANSIKDNLISPGQELRIPLNGGEQFTANASGKKNHRVAKGDTLWNISKRYSVSLGKLLRWNQLHSKSILQPGQSLVVFQ